MNEHISQINEQRLRKLLQETLPASDLASVSDDVLDSYIQHALFLRSSSPFCKDIPEDMFLHFVFYPRINSEEIVACRPFFYNKLWERIQGLQDVDAILEVNRWCAEHVTYRPSDDRTESPLTAYFSGIGRCGEESVFTVSALRSVGIPARQIYVPCWSHCDDNHAWVEAWAGGSWHFLGACEPEPILDRGWFIDASSRAPTACYRTFFEYPDHDPLLDRQGCAWLYNVISRYADTASLSIQLQGSQCANVHVNVLNMAAFRPVAGINLSPGDSFRLDLGKGTYQIEAICAGAYAQKIIRITDSSQFVILEPKPYESCTQDLDFFAPDVSRKNDSRLSEADKDNKLRILEQCRSKQQAWMEHPVPNTEIPNLQTIVNTAGHNASEIMHFVNAVSQKEEAVNLLTQLSEKDLRDICAETLLHHWNHAAAYIGSDHFSDGIVCPRIGNEVIRSWRGIRSILPDELCQNPHPARISDWLWAHYVNNHTRTYPELTMTPDSVIRFGSCPAKDFPIFVVAVLRDLGIPARLSVIDQQAEYWNGTTMCKVCPVETGDLCLEYYGEQIINSGENYTLSKLEDDRFRILNAPVNQTMQLPAGFYQLVTTTRLPNGNQLGRIQSFMLHDGDTLRIPVSFRTAEPEQMLNHILLEPFSLQAKTGELFPSSALLHRKTLLVYLKPGEEPSEHVLTELSHAADAAADVQLILVTPSDPIGIKLDRICPSFASCMVMHDHGNASEQARKLFLEPEVYPLLILTDGSHIAYYGSCGYNVGSVSSAITLSRCIPE